MSTRRSASTYVAVGMALLAAAWLPAWSAEKTYAPDTLIIPMDTTWQDRGVFLAYGLVNDLLRAGTPVDWVIQPGKTYGGVDFRATAVDLQSGAPIVDNDYRGGPFVVDALSVSAALPRVLAWQAAHPEVTVHLAREAFAADAATELRFPPNVAVVAAGGEADAFTYLNAAGIPMSNGDGWPPYADWTGAYACPGTFCCPDCLAPALLEGATSAHHDDGALFDGEGVPRYCHLVAMGLPGSTAKGEVIAEVRSFLEFPVSLFATSQAVVEFENDTHGRFLTTAGLDPQGPSSRVDYFASDDPTAQADGEFQNSGGGAAAYALASGSSYFDGSFPRVSRAGTSPGVGDVMIGGNLLGNPEKGKVTYLGGKAYEVALPISKKPKSQGVRYFLDSVFASPCVASEGAPQPSVAFAGAAATDSDTYALEVCYGNSGSGIAFAADLVLSLPAGATVVSASPGGTASGGSLSWSLGSVPPGEEACLAVTVNLEVEGNYSFAAELKYRVGTSEQVVSASAPLSLRFGRVNLLRFGDFTSLSPWSPAPTSVFAGVYPTDPTLAAARDLEVVAFVSGAPFPHETSDLFAGSPPLVLYQLQGNTAGTLSLSRDGDKVVVTY
jgi:hypothetical protein